MSSASVFRTVPLISSLTLAAVAGLVTAVQPACGRSDLETTCLAHKYRVTPFVDNTLLAIFAPGDPEEQATHSFVVPSYIVDIETHQAIVDDPNGDAADRLRGILADATRELCRRTIEAEIPQFDFRIDPNNCNEYAFENISLEDLSEATVTADDFDEGGPTIEGNPACFGACLLEDCPIDGTDGYDDPPDHPFARTVRCKCQLEAIDGCSPLSDALFPPQLASSITDGFCVPGDEVAPANYCRTTIADYFNASVRAINHYGGIHDPYDGECGSYTPAVTDVVVECLLVDAYGDIVDVATGAYTQQEDGCNVGCSKPCM